LDQGVNILHVSTDDSAGGAAKAAHRLHAALRAAGHESRMLVQSKRSSDPAVEQLPPPRSRPWTSRAEGLRRRFPGLKPREWTAKYTYNFDRPPQADWDRFLSAWREPAADVLCLHWIDGLLDVRTIRRLHDWYRRPIVWVPADQEPVTGGCHYSFGCEGFTKQCGCCPQLDSDDPRDTSHALWQRKRRELAGARLAFVAPTGWVETRIRESSLFGGHRVETIPYAIDTGLFRPYDARVARDLLRLPLDKKILFFGATYLEDRRKGMPLLIEALNRLAARCDASRDLRRDEVFLHVAGLNGQDLLDRLPFAGCYAGLFQDDLTLALAYQAADLFVCPSVEDAGPMMIPEAMLCGTPVVAFDAGGAPDLIRSGENGYLAAPGDADDLAQGLHALLTTDRLPAMRALARATALAAHAPDRVANRYAAFFAEVSQAVELAPRDGRGC
jgi:glycosyltransferase involved in cell wall biosynthesis